MTDEQYLDMDEAAALLGVTRGHITGWSKERFGIKAEPDRSRGKFHRRYFPKSFVQRAKRFRELGLSFVLAGRLAEISIMSSDGALTIPGKIETRNDAQRRILQKIASGYASM